MSSLKHNVLLQEQPERKRQKEIKIRKRKKAFGIQMQTTASIAEAGTRGNIRNDVGY